jgi:putative transposase
MKKNYTANFKAQVVLDLLKEEKTITEIASEYGVHPTQLRRWKEEVTKNLPSLFSDENKASKIAKSAQEKKMGELYSEIGRLTTQLNWLKKKSGIDLSQG